MLKPITTSDHVLEFYNGDKDHFLHVLDDLFIPAVKSAGLEPISPISAGTTVIHKEIIEKLQNCDMALVDMSILNANVFFELGVRTALNKPISLIIDDNDYKPPFDLSSVNHHKYKSDLQSWIIKEEIPKLTKHISDSIEKTGNFNELWKIFGLGIEQAGKPAEESINSDSPSIDLLKMKIDGLHRKVDQLVERDMHEITLNLNRNSNEYARNVIEIINENEDQVNNTRLLEITFGAYVLITDKELKDSTKNRIVKFSQSKSKAIKFEVEGRQQPLF